MRIALDTNRYVDFARGDADVIAHLETADAVVVPLIVLAELRAGFAVGTQGARNEGGLRRFLLRSGVILLAPDEQTTHHFATVYRQLRLQGTPIPTNDMWIAALVIQHGLALYARDAHFDHLPQIPRI
ncbi:MAG: type II toxin-antitoxin system VapC family toxin [Phycisphaerae bacterium]|nr:type II toxin-antitoxin system VapC family toxin [Gemmatimonadaceae bacterium]